MVGIISSALCARKCPRPHDILVGKKRAKTCPLSVTSHKRSSDRFLPLSVFHPLCKWKCLPIVKNVNSIFPLPFLSSSSLVLPRFKMFECHLVQGSVLRKVMEAISALVDNGNIECSSTGGFGTCVYLFSVFVSRDCRERCVVRFSRDEHAGHGHQQRVPCSNGTQRWRIWALPLWQEHHLGNRLEKVSTFKWAIPDNKDTPLLRNDNYVLRGWADLMMYWGVLREF